MVLEPLLVEPVGAGDLLERVDGGLDSLGPGDGDQFDVAVHVSRKALVSRQRAAAPVSGDSGDLSRRAAGVRHRIAYAITRLTTRAFIPLSFVPLQFPRQF